MNARRGLHTLLGLRDDRPLLRLTNALLGDVGADAGSSVTAAAAIENEKHAQEHLLNVHALINSIASGGNVCVRVAYLILLSSNCFVRLLLVVGVFFFFFIHHRNIYFLMLFSSSRWRESKAISCGWHVQILSLHARQL